MSAEERPSIQVRLAQAWRSGYYTGKRDYAGSVMGGAPITTPNPYDVCEGCDWEKHNPSWRGIRVHTCERSTQ